MKIVAFRIAPAGSFYRVVDFNGMALIERRIADGKYDVCGECLPTQEAIDKLKGFTFTAK